MRGVQRQAHNHMSLSLTPLGWSHSCLHYGASGERLVPNKGKCHRRDNNQDIEKLKSKNKNEIL